ncbi:hypothetical protein CR194_07125 [Salipaludibacillus keqinensis]|uniref:Uncharacterized protein n=1 Tax=Salipaludibacillus keqinensis TaxID=2045207 RepID=A0A323U0B8_9BACI|nr:hypothetical protein [Salipaludibacillus keqinensis]PYZ95275.1 hypothetical protein CR194_07125 [Salipaludibacillus keqinensis]
MDQQKKQTTDHDKLVREWFQTKNVEVTLSVPVKIGKIKKGSFYAVFSDIYLYLFEVIDDRDVNLLEKHPWEDFEHVMMNPSWFKLRVMLDQTVDLSFSKNQDRVMNFLTKKQELKTWEFERNWWSRMLGK